MRYERKYKIRPIEELTYANFLKGLGFKELFKERLVNSLYYDDANFNLYQLSDIGLAERKKIRARYYGNGSRGFIST